MIVFDVSTLVGVVMRKDSTPYRAFRHAIQTDEIAISDPVMAELLDVLHRPRLARFIDPDLRVALINQLLAQGVRFSPSVRVTDCRDAKDNKYLELAVAAHATALISSDEDLLVLHPWNGMPVLQSAEYLAAAGAQD